MSLTPQTSAVRNLGILNAFAVSIGLRVTFRPMSHQPQREIMQLKEATAIIATATPSQLYSDWYISAGVVCTIGISRVSLAAANDNPARNMIWRRELRISSVGRLKVTMQVAKLEFSSKLMY